MLMKLYQHLPVPLRSLAATMHGYRLHRWRYGPETQQLIEEARLREQWSPECWKAWREEQLGYILHRAATRVPYYAAQWSRRRQRGDRSSWEYLENWPVLSKEELRQCPKAFVADDCEPRRMYHERTSGTTGLPLDLWRSRWVMRKRYALFELRYRAWYHVSRHDRWAMLGGQLVTPVQQRKPPFWVWNAALHQLYMSAYHLASDHIPSYVTALQRYRIEYLWGYTSCLNAVAQEIITRGLDRPKMKVVITNAEPMFDYQRRAIEQAFQCPVRETYGMAELVAAGSECEAGQLHLWPEIGLVEQSENGSQAESTLSGALLCTSILNADMPLIRYAVGDRGRLQPDDSLCSCGRSLPLMSRIEGRNNDRLITPDGRYVYWLNPVFYGLPVREAQIVQHAADRVRVRYVPASNWQARTGEVIADRLRERMGEIQVYLEAVDQVPRDRNGKFRAVICEIPEPPPCAPIEYSAS